MAHPFCAFYGHGIQQTAFTSCSGVFCPSSISVPVQGWPPVNKLPLTRSLSLIPSVGSSFLPTWVAKEVTVKRLRNGLPTYWAPWKLRLLPFLLRILPLLVTLSCCRFRTLLCGSLEPELGDALSTYLLCSTTFVSFVASRSGHVCTWHNLESHDVRLSRASFNISAEAVVDLFSIHPSRSFVHGRDALRICSILLIVDGVNLLGILLGQQATLAAVARCKPCLQTYDHLQTPRSPINNG